MVRARSASCDRRALEGGRARARRGRARAALGPTPCCAASQAPIAPMSPCNCLQGNATLPLSRHASCNMRGGGLSAAHASEAVQPCCTVCPVFTARRRRCRVSSRRAHARARSLLGSLHACPLRACLHVIGRHRAVGGAGQQVALFNAVQVQPGDSAIVRAVDHLLPAELQAARPAASSSQGPDCSPCGHKCQGHRRVQDKGTSACAIPLLGQVGLEGVAARCCLSLEEPHRRGSHRPISICAACIAVPEGCSVGRAVRCVRCRPQPPP